jgi:hypothetical protein
LLRVLIEKGMIDTYSISYQLLPEYPLTSNEDENYEVIASTEHDGTYAGYKAFDSDQSTFWVTTESNTDPQSISLRSINGKFIPFRIGIHPRIGYLNEAPKHMQIWGIDDLNEELIVDLDNISDWSDSGLKQVPLNNGKPYSSIKIVSMETDYANIMCAFAEIIIYAIQSFPIPAYSSEPPSGYITAITAFSSSNENYEARIAIVEQKTEDLSFDGDYNTFIHDVEAPNISALEADMVDIYPRVHENEDAIASIVIDIARIDQDITALDDCIVDIYQKIDVLNDHDIEYENQMTMVVNELVDHESRIMALENASPVDNTQYNDQ